MNLLNWFTEQNAVHDGGVNEFRHVCNGATGDALSRVGATLVPTISTLHRTGFSVLCISLQFKVTIVSVLFETV